MKLKEQLGGIFPEECELKNNKCKFKEGFENQQTEPDMYGLTHRCTMIKDKCQKIRNCNKFGNDQCNTTVGCIYDTKQKKCVDAYDKI